ncbi:MAG TPA: sulfite reductase subunit beta [Methanosarcinales archaeon]|nr:sulfite reductase subunit beta [Methanosarcinales archaeon]
MAKMEIYKGMPAVFKRKDGNFEIKLLVTGGMLTPEQMKKVSEVSEKYGNGDIRLTVRQEFAIFGIPESKLDSALAELAEVGLVPGSAGPKIRNVTSCIGGEYCFKAAATDTTSLAKEIGARFSEENVPGPLKIGISACPYPCTRPQFNEIGLMGRVKPDLNIDDCTGCGICVEVCKTGATSLVDGFANIDYDKCIMCGRCVINCPEGARYAKDVGYIMFVGGRGGWPPYEGKILHNLISSDKIIPQIERIVKVYQEHGEKGKRMKEFIDKIGFEEFKKSVGI